jgi:hypothetical protein
VNEALRAQTAGPLRQTYRWMSAASEVTPAVTQVAPALTAAVQLYDAGDYPAAMRQLSAVVSVLHQVRQVYPALPPL